MQAGGQTKGYFSSAELVRQNLQPRHNGKILMRSGGHKFKVAHDQGCGDIYEKQTWISGDGTGRGGGWDK